MINRPFASIIVPTYNQVEFLEQALDSLRKQTDQDWEAIVVDDGSTDSTAEVAKRYVNLDRRFRFFQKSNGGVASALNAGLKMAKGDWIHWLSSDDMFEPLKLEINRRWINDHPNCSFFYSYFTLLREATGVKDRRELWGPIPDPDLQILTLFYRNFVSGITICVRRTAWEDVGFFNEALYYAQDYDQWLRLLAKNQAIFIPEWTVISRNHAAQGSEIFPDACYFDTAKAAISFINQHSFAELVPWIDLSDRVAALSAVSSALKVSSDPTSFLYCLGPHLALVGRVLEWAFSERCSHPQIKSLVLDSISEMSFIDSGVDTEWNWMWRTMAVAVHGGADSFPYQSVDPIQLALREHRTRCIQGASSHGLLSNYLARFEGVTTNHDVSIERTRSRIVFLIDHGVPDGALLAAADTMAGLGYRLLVVCAVGGGDFAAYEVNGRVPIILVAKFDENTLPWLGQVDLAVTLCDSAVPTWIASLSHIFLTDDLSQLAVERQVLSALARGNHETVRPIVFLERVQWGGGAERVVFDLVQHLNRQKFRPIVLTMFNEHTVAPAFRSDVELRHVRPTNA